MTAKRLRLNRKDGLIYLELSPTDLKPLGKKLDCVVLWHSPPFLAAMFGMQKQAWIQFAVLSVDSGNLAYFVQNSGTTYALKPWSDFSIALSQRNVSLLEIIVRFQFTPFGEDWFDYAFEAFDKPGTKEKVMRWIFANKDISLIDESLPAHAVQILKLGNKRKVKDLIPIIAPHQPKYVYTNYTPLEEIQPMVGVGAGIDANDDDIPF